MAIYLGINNLAVAVELPPAFHPISTPTSVRSYKSSLMASKKGGTVVIRTTRHLLHENPEDTLFFDIITVARFTM